jgi:1-acyl-sn-glycerol-3-phosphate acyltransferase
MAKGVLGNDPFQRGAASRGPPPPHSGVEKPKARPAGRTRGWKARAGAEGSPPTARLPDEVPARPDPELGRSRGLPENAVAPSLNLGDVSIQLLKGTYRALRTVLGLTEPPVDAYGEDPELMRQLSPLADFLHDRYWRVSVQGAAQIPVGSCLIVANHAGALPLDGPMLRLAIARHRPDLPAARWLAEENVLQVPILGVLLRRIGAVRATPENALQLLADRKPLIVFPEGMHGATKSFRRRYELRPFGRGGFVKIAARARAPIVPVAIVGAGEAMPMLASLPIQSFGLPYLPVTVPPLPTKWLIRVGEPLEIEQIDPEDASEIARWTERVRGSVQQMLHDILSSRRSIFGG